MDYNQTYSFYCQMLSNLKLIKQMTDPMITQVEGILNDMDPKANKENIKPLSDSSKSVSNTPTQTSLSQNNVMKLASGQARALTGGSQRFAKGSSKDRNINNVTPTFDLQIPKVQEKSFSHSYNRQNSYEDFTEIQQYLQQEYIHIPLNSEQMSDEKLRIKDYALRCKREYMTHVLDFIAERQTTFLKIWVLINRDEDELAFVLKQIHAKNPSFFKKYLKYPYVEFHVLKPERDIPNKIKEFLVSMHDTLIYNLIQNNKGGSDFMTDVRDLENFMNVHEIPVEFADAVEQKMDFKKKRPGHVYC